MAIKETRKSKTTTHSTSTYAMQHKRNDTLGEKKVLTNDP